MNNNDKMIVADCPARIAAIPLVPAVPMWTMVSERLYNRTRLHIANDNYITFCGNSKMLVRDYVELHNDNIYRVGECRSFTLIPDYEICKRCSLSVRHRR